jgi:CBS domain-containing protein
MTTHATLAERPMVLRARTASDLMTPSPLSLYENLTVREAIAFLVDRGISGAPVIDDAGRPVGVLSQSDILVHDRQKVEHAIPAETDSCRPLPRRLLESFQIEAVDPTPVRDLMTPAVFSVGIDTPANSVVEQMRELNVHRLFVVDTNGVLMGVISALDVLRHLEVEE